MTTAPVYDEVTQQLTNKNSISFALYKFKFAFLKMEGASELKVLSMYCLC